MWESVVKLVMTALSAGLLVASGAASAGAPQGQPPKPSMLTTTLKNTGPMTTARFVQHAATTDVFAIQAGQLALQKTKDESVRKFAQEMISTHSDAAQKLKKAVTADKVDVQIPGGLDKSDAKNLDRLKGASGADFDNLYVRTQVKEQHAELKLMHNYSQSGNDAALRQFASAREPVLRDHLKLAEKLDKGPSALNVGPTGSSSQGGGTEESREKASPSDKR
jgi:putative membrane protein